MCVNAGAVVDLFAFHGSSWHFGLTMVASLGVPGAGRQTWAPVTYWDVLEHSGCLHIRHPGPCLPWDWLHTHPFVCSVLLCLTFLENLFHGAPCRGWPQGRASSQGKLCWKTSLTSARKVGTLTFVLFTTSMKWWYLTLGDGNRHFPGAAFPSQGQAARTLSVVSLGYSPAEDCSCKCHQRWESEHENTKKGLGWTWLISGSSASWEGECIKQDFVMHLNFSQQNCGEVWWTLWRVVDFLRKVNNVA